MRYGFNLAQFVVKCECSTIETYVRHFVMLNHTVRFYVSLILLANLILSLTFILGYLTSAWQLLLPLLASIYTGLIYVGLFALSILIVVLIRFLLSELVQFNSTQRIIRKTEEKVYRSRMINRAHLVIPIIFIIISASLLLVTGFFSISNDEKTGIELWLFDYGGIITIVGVASSWFITLGFPILILLISLIGRRIKKLTAQDAVIVGGVLILVANLVGFLGLVLTALSEPNIVRYGIIAIVAFIGALVLAALAARTARRWALTQGRESGV